MKWPEQINQVVEGDNIESLRAIPDGSVHCVVTSHPYFRLRDYQTATWEGGDPECEHKPNHGIQGKQGDRANRTHTAEAVYKNTCGKCGAERKDLQRGLEKTPQEYVNGMVDVFREVRRVLRDDGTLWLNLGDSYAGSWGNQGRKKTRGEQRPINGPMMQNLEPYPDKVTKTGSIPPGSGLKPKDLIGIPWMLAFALRADGWYLRQDIIWHKTNPMPESIGDRCTKAHEYVFLLSKSGKYFCDMNAIKEPVSGTAKTRGNGVNPKVLLGKAGDSIKAKGHRTRPKQNASFAAAVSGLVKTRNKRSVWTVSTRPYKEAHFATFPPALIEPCILAGTSERGACSQCGSPLIRQIKKEGGRDWRNDKMKTKGIPGELNGEGSYKRGQSTSPLNDVKTTITIGWKPACQCNAKTTPCIVLDPFGGAGTTAVVAAQNERRYIMLELNPEYCDIARRRIAIETEQGRLL